MSDLALWGLFLAVGVGTFALRLSFVELYGNLRVPPLVSRALAYVPASVLAALVLPAVVYPEGHGDFVLGNPQIPAAVLAALVAWKTRNTVLTLAVGMGALWGLKMLMH
ncbi:AzlD domain-containing protein [Pseudomonas putida CSV86]|uniref:Branched-chain amino acid ABC transporter n=2 Tax=Pseudomonas TaxID=286 RepID=A0A177SLN2_PSEPU|nr:MULTISPECIES: AzlD domain-containing protein [Pseudomonas]MDG9884873.1 AzlD domain-containing protein [Pseudomonas sp. GD04058]NNJ19095.1 AzlD domain-containing protein [Pseudomonas bharatica CSV86]OAI91470.1 branched-chain amino acid ABC transporter [Pseudomonas putida]